jgi:hypothetical protein
MTFVEEKTISDIETYGKNHDALVFVGAGGDLQQWVDGITGMLKDDEIVSCGFQFAFAWTFRHPMMYNIICLLLPIDDTDVGKLAIWRIKNQNLDVEWLSDFLDRNINACSTHGPDFEEEEEEMYNEDIDRDDDDE